MQSVTIAFETRHAFVARVQRDEPPLGFRRVTEASSAGHKAEEIRAEPEDRAAVSDRCICGAADQSDDQAGGMIRGHGFRPPPR